MKQVTQCPVCDSRLEVTELSCAQCATRLCGAFPQAPLARLSDEHQQFVVTFVCCRGIIRDVERALGISYPTVRARLDAVVSALEAEVNDDRRAERPERGRGDRDDSLPRNLRMRALLRRVEEGELEPEEAAKALRKLKS